MSAVGGNTSLLQRYSQVFPVGSAGSRFTAILKRRRQRHIEALDGFAIFAGVSHEPGAENIWHMNGLKIFQEPALIHLCGINQPGIVLALIPGGKSQEILFVPEKNPDKEFWDGVRFGYPTNGNPKTSKDLKEVRKLTGIQDVRPMGQFDAWFVDLVRRNKKSWGYSFYHQYPDPVKKGGFRVTTTDHNFAFEQRLEKIAIRARRNFEIRSSASLHFKLRLPLEPEQIKDVAKATAITGSAFIETLRSLSKFRNENELSAHLEHGMRRRSPYGLSFPSIVAGGRNATVLHYLKNDEPLKHGSLVLIDFGARYGTMHADISRTIPLSGKFNPLQRLLYGIVLDALRFNQHNAKPGNTIRKMNEDVWAFIENELQTRFYSKGGKAERAYSGKPHGVSHLMGEQEHDGDPHRIYHDEPLKPGWQISNEPGLYGHFSIRLGGRRYAEWIGIRIEDNLLVTPKGCRNLSESIPREPEDIERLIGLD
ncbi:MAG TPA: peptidase M24 [Fibrobacteres bacterium]|jgi:Xaa-Pro aminopeptidase|nr:peptidase M24 [Fibrobacterota bacterium]